MNIDYSSYKINLFNNLCESPKANNSNLAKNALKLLHSGHLSDLEFEIVTIPTTVNENSISNSSDQYHHEGDIDKSGSAKKEYHIFKAHRVIVAARFVIQPLTKICQLT